MPASTRTLIPPFSSISIMPGDGRLTPEVLPEHASYLDAWLKVMKADTKAVFNAAAHAERAADYLQKLQPSVES